MVFREDSSLLCEDAFEGGGWLQVRAMSVGQSPQWFQATDGLRGVDVYGYTTDPEYSIYYNHLLRPTSELLFFIGKNCSANIKRYA